MATEARIVLSAEDKVTAVVRRVQGSLAALSTSISSIGTGFGIGVIVAGFQAIVRSMDELTKAAEGIGVTAKELAEFRLAAQQSGLGAEQLDNALARLNVKIEDAASGNKEAIRWFKDLGIAFKDTQGNARGVADVVRDMARVFANSADGPGKTALAIEGLGKQGAKAIPWLNKGAEEVQKFAGVSDQAAKDAAKLQDEMDKLTASFKNFLTELGGKTAGIINKLFDTSPEQKMAELQTIIASMEHAGTGDPRNLERYKEELKALQDIAIARGSAAAEYGADAAKPPLKKTDTAAIDAALREAERLAKIRQENQKEGLAFFKLEEEQAGKRAIATLENYNRELQQSIDLKEEDRQAGLKRNRELEDQQGNRARAQVDAFNKQLEESKKLGEDLGLVFESAISRLIAGGEGFTAKSFFKALADDITQTIIKITLLEPLIAKLKQALSGATTGAGTSIFGSILGAIFGRASGGPVTSGRPYIVGEQGPELFVPNISGSIVPNGATGSVTIVQNVSVDARSDIASVRAAMDAAKNAAVREVGNQLARNGALARV